MHGSVRRRADTLPSTLIGSPSPPQQASSSSSSSSGVGGESSGDAGRTCRSQSVKAPKDWCGIFGAKTAGCFDKWEKSYMEENADKLREGLELIRAPGCFPTGTSVATMGYFRTGSTLLYNIARVWAALAADGSLVAGWLCKDPRTLGIGVLGEEQAECTSVCKDHTWHTGIPESTTVVLMSRRDPFYSVCSRKLMDVWCNMDQSNRKEKASWSEIYAYKKKCKTDPELEMPEAVKQCHALMEMQADIYFEREMKGKSVAYDMLNEDYMRDPAAEIQKVGLAMGVCEAAAAHPELVHFIQRMGEELKSHPDRDMGITQMHDVHTAKQRQLKCSNLEAWMHTDPACAAWMDSNASHTANAVLQGYMKDEVKKRKARKTR